MNIKTIVGNSILILWLGAVLATMVLSVDQKMPILIEFLGKAEAFSFVIWILGWLCIFWAGRFTIEWILNKV